MTLAFVGFSAGTLNAERPCMLDAVFLALALAFFVIALTYVWGCTKL
jgi:hypothetical protein